MFKALAVVLLISTAALAETKTYTVKGMHCDECRKNIEAQVCQLPGVDSRKVEMGQVTLMSKAALDDAKVKGAVKKAGHYTVTETKNVTSAADQTNK